MAGVPQPPFGVDPFDAAGRFTEPWQRWFLGATLGIGAVPTTNLTGTLQAAQEPAHSGDVTNAAGSLVAEYG